MIHRAPRLALLAAIALVVTASPASAAQLNAGEYPTERGPLVLQSRECERKIQSFHGTVVAVLRSCLYIYTFNDSREFNARRNFGVAWLQTNVNADNGWCAARVSSNIKTADAFRLHDRTPPARTAETAEWVRARVVADAQGASDARGVVRNGFKMYPGALTKAVVVRPSGAHVYKTRWTGSSARFLGFASGVELSWPARAASSELTISHTLGFALLRSDDC